MEKRKLPSLDILYDDKGMIARQSELNQILNANPKKEWVKQHPTVSVKNKNGEFEPLKYIPIEVVEYLLTSIYVKWRVEIKSTQLIANSVVVTVRLYVQDPITMDWDFQDGIGASAIQTDKGAGAIEFNLMKTAAIQMAAPSAESYAVKDAAEKLGRIFGKDLNRKESFDIIPVMEAKQEQASINQWMYANELIRTSTLDEASRQDIERRLEGNLTTYQCGEVIEYLLNNQQSLLDYNGGSEKKYAKAVQDRIDRDDK